MTDQILGVAYIDIRARLTKFDEQLRTGVRASLAGTASEFTTGGRAIDRAALDMERGLKTRLSGFAERTGLKEIGSEVNRAANSIGVPLKVAVPAAFALVTAETIKMSGKFQSEMQLLVSAAGEAQGAISGMGKAVLQTARDTGTSTEQLTSGLYQLEKAGYRGAEATNVLRVAAEGARAEGASLATVTSALTSVMASFHVPASQSTEAMNAIIAAAGESKTTMENFAGALSTVLPVASAAKVSFAEVAGAVATLTQHGTSAQESTQELASLIRNLQAPMGPASNLIQQLGLNVNKLSLGLGDPQIGLIGTLRTVLDTVNKHMGPAGLVAYDAFKKSQSASQDLQIVLSKMSPGLRDMSKRFLDGSMSLMQFRRGFRDLGATGAVQGTQFLNLVQKTNGFNDLIKSGAPAMQTYVAALKQLFGGTIGLNTVLQITGPNLEGFIERTNRVSEMARKGGKDIATWGSVQKSFNVQMGQLRQYLDTAMIALGDKLLPTVSRAVTATTNWFSHLHDGGGILENVQQKFGPFAGAVELVHTAFVTVSAFIRTALIPAIKNIIVGLAPLGEALVRGAKTALHFANDALGAIAKVLRTVVAPVLRTVTEFFKEHGKVIANDAVIIAQFLAILGGVGVAMKLYSGAVALATTTSATFGGMLTTLRVLMLALADGTLVEYMGQVTKSTIALTIAEGAQAVVTRAVAVVTGVWTAAQLLLSAAINATTISQFAAEAGALLRMIPGVVTLTELWTAAQAQLDIALDANPIGIVILAIGALVAAIAFAVTHVSRLRKALGDIIGIVGGELKNAINIIKGMVDIVVALFTLDGSKLIHGLEGIGKALLSIPLDVLKGLGHALEHTFGDNSPWVMHLTKVGKVLVFNDMVAALVKVKKTIDDVNTSVNRASFSQFDDSVKQGTDAVNAALKPLNDLSKIHDDQKIKLDGHTFSMKQFNAALEQTHGDGAAAVAMLETLDQSTQQYKDELNKLQAEQTTFDTTLATTSKNLGLTSDDVQKYGAFMAVTAQQVATGSVNQSQFQALVYQAQGAVAGATGAMASYVTQLLTYQNSAKTATDDTDLFKAALDALTGQSQSVNVAVAQANQEVANLASSVKASLDPTKSFASQLGNAHTGAINLTGAGGQLTIGMGQLSDQLKNAADAAFAQNRQTMEAGPAAEAAAAAYQKLANSSIAQLASQLGLSAAQVKSLHQELDLTPDKKQILIQQFGLTQTTQGMQTLLNTIDGLRDKTVNVTLRVNAENKQHAMDVARSANGNLFSAFAGGAENHIAQIAGPGALRLWAEPETGGEGYIPLASSKRPRSEAILGTIAKMFGGAYVNPEKLKALGLQAFANGGIEVPPITSFQVSRGSGKHKHEVTRYLFNNHEYATLRAAENARTMMIKHVKEEQKKLAQQRTNIENFAIPKFLSSLGGSSQLITDSASSLVKSIESITSPKLTKKMISETQQLGKIADQRDAVAAQLKDANQKLVDAQKLYADEMSNTTKAVAGAFNITSAGNYNGYATVGTVLDSLKRQAAEVHQFTGDISALQGKGLNTDLLTQLEHAGSGTAGATVKALAGASADQIAQVNALFAQVNSDAAGVGKTAADTLYGAGVQAAQGVVDGLTKQQAALEDQMKKLADVLAKQIAGVLDSLVTKTTGHTARAAAKAGVGKAAAGAQHGAAHPAEHPAGRPNVVIHNHVAASPGMNETALAGRVARVQETSVRYHTPVNGHTTRFRHTVNVSPPVNRR